MKFLNPQVNIFTETDNLRKIEYICRVCTGTQDKTGTDPKFVQKRWNEGHGSVFEHLRVIVPEDIALGYIMVDHQNLPYGAMDRINWEVDDCCIMNARDFLHLGGTLDELKNFKQDPDFVTAEFVIDIGIARELIRHRQMSFTERSTRYCKFDDNVEYINPIPLEWASGTMNPKYLAWFTSCRQAENLYCMMREAGCSPQEARAVLPLSTATILYMSGTRKQWDDVIKLRTSAGAHPQMKYIINQLKEKMQ